VCVPPGQPHIALCDVGGVGRLAAARLSSCPLVWCEGFWGCILAFNISSKLMDPATPSTVSSRDMLFSQVRKLMRQSVTHGVYCAIEWQHGVSSTIEWQDGESSTVDRLGRSRGCAFLIQQQQEQGMCMFNTAAATAGDVHF
jgi:hypothetical protein